MSDGEGVNISFGGIIKGSVVGGLVSMLASYLVAMPFMNGTPKSQAEAEALTKALVQNPTYLVADLIVSLICVAVGGYVAAGSEESSGTTQGAMTGGVLLLVFGGMAMASSQSMPGWYSALLFVLMVPSGALGGKLR